MKSLSIFLLLFSLPIYGQVYHFKTMNITAWVENNQCLITCLGYAQAGGCQAVYSLELIEPQRGYPPDIKISWARGDSSCLDSDWLNNIVTNKLVLKAYCATIIIPQAEQMDDRSLLKLFYIWSANVGPEFFQSLLSLECRKKLAYLIVEYEDKNTADRDTRERATQYLGRENKNNSK